MTWLWLIIPVAVLAVSWLVFRRAGGREGYEDQAVELRDAIGELEVRVADALRPPLERFIRKLDEWVKRP